MPIYKLRVPDQLAEFIWDLHPEIKRKIKGSLRIIATEPDSGKPLKEELEGLRSFRVSRFRIVYRMAEAREIHIIAIGPRERIYEETYRLIRKEDKESQKRSLPCLSGINLFWFTHNKLSIHFRTSVSLYYVVSQLGGYKLKI